MFSIQQTSCGPSSGVDFAELPKVQYNNFTKKLTASCTRNGQAEECIHAVWSWH